MQRLHLLGFTNDLKGVVFGQRKGTKKPAFWVPIDSDFAKAMTKLERARNDKKGKGKAKGKAAKLVDEKPPAPLPPVGRSQQTSKIPVSEMQNLLRRGRSAKSVADTAKVSLAWVERLAEPVMTERLGVVQLARRARMPRARLGISGLPVGEAVERNLEERRAVPEGMVWDARMSASGAWRVWLRYDHRGSRRTAEWEFRKDRLQIRAKNRLASQLGWWPPEAPTQPAPSDEEEPDIDELEAAEAPQRMGAEPKKRPRRRKTRPTSKARSRPKRRKAPARRRR